MLNQQRSPQNGNNQRKNLSIKNRDRMLLISKDQKHLLSM